MTARNGEEEPLIPKDNDDGREHHTALQRALSARQVQMIAIGGTIGTGLFLGTGKSLAEAGPGSMLIAYSITAVTVYVTLQLLAELGTQYPISGSFNVYASRFVSDAFGFAVAWNYWLNDAVSVASDLTAAQLLLNYWTDWHPWVISLVFLVFLLSVNAFHVNAYGELEYWLSSIKVVTIILFIIIGTLVNAGVSRTHHPIGFENWRIGDAPFVNGWHGFGKVFVTASFAYGGTESLGITAGETKNPTKNMPRVARLVFFRIVLFYLISIFIIGLNVPYNTPNLSNRDITTSPFTIIFAQAGSNIAASFMNTVILSSVLSAGNHALFAGTRVLHALSVSSQAPSLFARTNRAGVPYVALLATSSVSAIAFGTSHVGSGVLWGWLQNLVGVSNQIAWFAIGLASWRFRKAWVKQGRPLSELKYHMKWTAGWGPPFVVFSVTFMIIFQGYASLFPSFNLIELLSLYTQIPLIIVLYTIRQVVVGMERRTGGYWMVDVKTVDLNVDEYDEPIEEVPSGSGSAPDSSVNGDSNLSDGAGVFASVRRRLGDLLHGVYEAFV